MLAAYSDRLGANELELARIGAKIRRLNDRAAKLRLENVEIGNQIHALRISGGSVRLPGSSTPSSRNLSMLRAWAAIQETAAMQWAAGQDQKTPG